MDSLPPRRVPAPGVRRCLFGRPDSAKVDQWLTETLDNICKEHETKWQFDFKADRPLETAHSDHEYEPIAASAVPSMYRPRVSHSKKPRAKVSAEVDPSVPSSSGAQFANVGEFARPLTRSCVKRSARIVLQTSDEPEKKVLKQAKLTNYLTVRKRRSVDVLPSPMKAVRRGEGATGDAPSSPFRFVSKEDEAQFDSTSPMTSPQKSPQKKRVMKPRAIQHGGIGGGPSSGLGSSSSADSSVIRSLRSRNVADI